MSFNAAEVSADLVTTTNAWTDLTNYQVSAGANLVITANVVARRADTDDVAHWSVRAVFRRDGTNPPDLIGSIINTISPVKTLGALLWDFRLYVDTDEYLHLDVKGASGHDVGWGFWGDIRYMEYPA